MPTTDPPATAGAPRRRRDAGRTRAALLEAAAASFVASGVEVPVREIAASAGVGLGTVYRHFPTRAELVVAVYHHQVEACAQAGAFLLASEISAYAALAAWIDLFVDFLVTKHGLAAAMASDSAGFAALHSSFLDRLVPVCAELLAAATVSGEVRADLEALQLMAGVGNLCIGAETNPDYQARRLVAVLLTGLRQPL